MSVPTPTPRPHPFTDPPHKPIHPATVHFPIAFLTLAWGIDILYAATTKLSIASLVQTIGTSLPDLARASHYLQVAGLVSAIPAVASGVQQMLQLQKFEADGKTMKPKFKLALTHAVANYTYLGATVYSWYTRKGNVGFLPSDVNMAISTVALPALFFAANLGAQPVYNHGTGMRLNGSKKGKST